MKRHPSSISLVDAVDALAQIAEMDWELPKNLSHENEEKPPVSFWAPEEVAWIIEEDAEISSQHMREIFRIILQYLRRYYNEEYINHEDMTSLDRMQNIMLIVGEAAKKFDAFTALFKKTQKIRVTGTREYKDLQKFYQQKLSKKIDEKQLSKWISALTTQEPQPKKGNVYRVVDLEEVKKDTLYDLLLMEKEDGSRFLNATLLRNMLLICDFGTQFQQIRGGDPLSDVEVWVDQLCFETAKNILQSSRHVLDLFFQSTHEQRDRESVRLVEQAIISLMMSSHESNRIEHGPKKSCREYFSDFQKNLHRVMHTEDYQRWITYPEQKEEIFIDHVLAVVHSLCHHFFLPLQVRHREVVPVTHLLKNVGAVEGISSTLHEQMVFWEKEEQFYAMMAQWLQYHPNGPLTKVLAVHDQSPKMVFDPLMQENIPNVLYDWYLPERKTTFVRIPCPTWQESISSAHIDEMFRGWLQSYLEDPLQKKHLLINLQDRYSWKNEARVQALEHLAEKKPFSEVLSVVTIATETDFVQQKGPFAKDNDVPTFFNHWVQELQSKENTYDFPPEVWKEIFPDFILDLFTMIHKIYFSGKNVLTIEQRQQFIDIFHIFLVLKIVDYIEPNSCSLTCKDGIDYGSLQSALLYYFLVTLQKDSMEPEEEQAMHQMIYAPSLLIRERVPLPEPFHRWIRACRCIEEAKNAMGHEAYSTLLKEGTSIFFRCSLDALIYP